MAFSKPSKRQAARRHSGRRQAVNISNHSCAYCGKPATSSKLINGTTTWLCRQHKNELGLGR